MPPLLFTCLPMPEIVLSKIKAGYRCLCKTEMKSLLYALVRGILQKSEAVLVVVDNTVGKVDQQLSEAALGCCVVAEDGRESGVAEWLWETLTESFAGACVVAEAG